MSNGVVISIAARSAAAASANPFAGSRCVSAYSTLLKARGVMRRVKLQTGKLWNNIALLAWAFVLAFVLSLILFGAMLGGAYVADEFYSPSLSEASSPRHGQTDDEASGPSRKDDREWS